MDDLNSKKAAPLIDYTFKEISLNLTIWRDYLRNELEALIYIKNCIIQQLNEQCKEGDSLQSQKLIRIIPKLECICLKEIDLMNEFLTEMSNSKYVQNSEGLYSKVESIRDNYNKVIVNIQKMFNNVPILEEYRNRYLKNIPMIPKITKQSSLKPQLKERSIEKKYKDNDDQGIDDENNLFNKKFKEPKLSNAYNSNNTTKIMTISNITSNKAHKDNDNLTDIKTKMKNTKGVIANTSKHFNLLNKNNNDICLTENNSNTSKTISKLASSSNKRCFNNSKSQRSTTPMNNKRINNPLNIALNHKSSSNVRGEVVVENESNAIQALNEEIQHIKSYFDEMNKTRQQYCLIQNEKKDFEKIKKENIKLIADVSILKDDMNDLLKCFQTLNDRVGKLQLDNDNLRQQNENLIAYISRMNNPNEISSYGNNERNCINKRRCEISDMSPFNSNVFISNNQSMNRVNVDNQSNTISNKDSKYQEQNQEMKQITDCYYYNNTANCGHISTSEISSNQIKTSYSMKEKRFLIPKNE